MREKIWELIPITSPFRLKSGPPELPGFTATSVCRNGTASLAVESAGRSRLLAERMPAVTELAKPKGEPMASTHSPTRIAVESPSLSAGRFVASTLMSATSERLSAPITLAFISRLSVKRTKISSAFSITCALVTM